MWNMNESSTDRCLPCPRALLPALHAETRTHARTHTQRGSYFRGAVPVEETVSVGGDEEGMPKPGEPLFVLKSQAMAVPPTKYKKPDDADDAPLGGLQMEFIYGARMIDSRACAQVDLKPSMHSHTVVCQHLGRDDHAMLPCAILARLEHDGLVLRLRTVALRSKFQAPNRKP